jgi:hypothetical protein
VPTESGSPELSNALGRIFSRFSEFALGHVVNELIGLSVQLEDAVSIFLAVYLGRDPDSVELLQSRIIGHVPYDTKLSLLESILEEENLTHEFPKLLPSARRIQFMRNSLAHSYPVNKDEQEAADGAKYQREFIRKGVIKRLSLDIQEMIDLTEAARNIISDQMPQLAFRYWPDVNDESEPG